MDRPAVLAGERTRRGDKDEPWSERRSTSSLAWAGLGTGRS